MRGRVGVLTPSGEVVQTSVSVAPDGTTAQISPSHPWRAGEHHLVISERLEDVCGNRLGEALDHDLSTGGRPRAGTISFTCDDIQGKKASHYVSNFTRS